MTEVAAWGVARFVNTRPSRARRIYLAGPMSGLPGHNYEAFRLKADELRTDGWLVENPAEHGIIPDAEWEDYLRWDLTRLVQCGSIYLLPGSEHSRGAMLEATIAIALGLHFHSDSAWRPAP
jgi:hypothetical protein